MEANHPKYDDMFAFEMMAYAFVDVHQLDEQIAKMAIDDSARWDLQEWRKLAEKAYLDGQVEYAAALIKATYCTAVYAFHSLEAYPMARARKKQLTANKENSQKPRRNARSEFKERIIAHMRQSKRNHESFDTFIQTWKREPLDGLRLTTLGKAPTVAKERYQVSDEDAEVEKVQEYPRSTLQRNYWSKAT